MILSDYDIKKAISEGKIEITGHELYIGPCSVDLHLENKAMILSSNLTSHRYLDISQKDKSADLFEEYKDWDYIDIMPGEFYILSTIERLKFSDDVVGFIQGRSSIARMGINIHCAGFFDAGFEGTATLEVTNFTRYPIRIPKDTRICQMVFAKTITPSEVPYSKKYDSKYMGQSGPTLTKAYHD